MNPSEIRLAARLRAEYERKSKQEATDTRQMFADAFTALKAKLKTSEEVDKNSERYIRGMQIAERKSETQFEYSFSCVLTLKKFVPYKSIYNGDKAEFNAEKIAPYIADYVSQIKITAGKIVGDITIENIFTGETCRFQAKMMIDLSDAAQ